MFTGIIEEIGKIKSIRKKAGNTLLAISADKLAADLTIGKSISINGACLTVTVFDKKTFTVEATKETMDKTNTGELKAGDAVNLEQAMKANGRFDGHFVLGHVDEKGKITKIRKLAGAVLLEVSAPASLSKYIVDKGSIAIDGISLTVVETKGETFSVNIIPHTFENTSLKFKKTGDSVNLETDIMAKYAEKIKTNKKGITKEFLDEKGIL